MNEEEEYDDLAGIFDDEELPEEYYDVQVSDIEVWLGWGGLGVPLAGPVSHDGGSQCSLNNSVFPSSL